MGQVGDRHGYRYTTVLSNGDTKTFKQLSEMEVYGSDVMFEKEECSNHVAKGMSTAILKLATGGRNMVLCLVFRGTKNSQATRKRHYLL